MTGEVGVLEAVRLSAVAQSTCFLSITYQGNGYLGTLSFDDDKFAQKICELLKQNCGRSLADIGSLDIG